MQDYRNAGPARKGHSLDVLPAHQGRSICHHHCDRFRNRAATRTGALIASLPLISVLGMIWLWRDTQDVARLAEHSAATFWYVLPSLPMFLVIPALLKRGVGFWPALLAVRSDHGALRVNGLGRPKIWIESIRSTLRPSIKLEPRKRASWFIPFT